jgi:hypothetical protein
VSGPRSQPSTVSAASIHRSAMAKNALRHASELASAAHCMHWLAYSRYSAAVVICLWQRKPRRLRTAGPSGRVRLRMGARLVSPVRR